ncbi:hypothetical protein FSP39_003109 [Pinctada imbricata]|uniref:Uncharacterized protein n=1 Tax=Pinctada imbricata TaxID=66713 RepID=A0AA88Y4P0_PINIB|nr:hypothetical protein FSP39_003109 [Pinctada imbricata]
MALAEHLFSPLASGYSYIIDSRAHGKGPNEICKCGCNSPVKFDATGMGHSKVWHGYADIIIKDENPVETVRVVTNPIYLDAGGDPGPSTAKKSKTEDDESVGMSSISEVKRKRKGYWDQTVAQTIVFALVQRQLNLCSGTFIPTILICQKQFYIFMYDPHNDILIWSGGFDLWRKVNTFNLNKNAIITLWMVIHYKLFCSGGDKLKNADKVKAGFMDRIEDEKKKYYSELDIFVSNFDTEKIDFLGQGHDKTDEFLNLEAEEIEDEEL